MTMTENDKPIEVMLHPALIPAFEQWLKGRGLEMVRMPEEFQQEGHLEQFMVTPTEETMRRWTS